MSSASTRDPLVGVADWLRQYSHLLVGQRIEDWRVLRTPLSHPLFGHLPDGITDGVLCYCSDLTGRVVHVTLGQCVEVKVDGRRAATDGAAKSRSTRPTRTKFLSADQLADLV